MADMDTDWQALAERARAGDDAAEEALFRRAKAWIAALVRLRGLFVPGGDEDDLVQYGLIGLWEALRDWTPAKGKFGPFARLCIRRNLNEAVKYATRVKHQILNDAVFLDALIGRRHGGEIEKHEMLKLRDGSGLARDPYLQLAEREHDLAPLLTATLSDLERDAVQLFIIDGYSYREAARRLGRQERNIDNALTRARKKAIQVAQRLATDESVPEDIRAELRWLLANRRSLKGGNRYPRKEAAVG